MNYFKTLTNFMLNNNYVMHNSKTQHQESRVAQGEYSSSMMTDLCLYYYEKYFKSYNIHLYRHVDDAILISTNSSNCLFLVNYSYYLKFKNT